MACVVLPSETARLVYGYLVKEKLDNIALLFLESSPYLKDCYHIVKSGYQFNTKFLYKELHELIQEYSTIQNLVNKKIGLLSKKSPLYKRIKLHCENLSEIIDSILFWRYNESRSEENSPIHSTVRISLDIAEKKTDKVNEMTVNNDNNMSIQESESDSYIGAGSPRVDKERGENEATNFEEIDGTSSIRCSGVEGDINNTDGSINCLVENVCQNNSERDINSGSKKFPELQVQSHKVSENSKENIEINIPLEPRCTDEGNKFEKPLMSQGSDVNIDGQIKIVRVEKDNQEKMEKNQIQNAFNQNLDVMESGMVIDSVLYVTPDVGNIINQDRNQVIVIPIDYYKTQNEIGNEQSQSQNLTGGISSTIATNSEIISEGVSCSISNGNAATAPTYNNVVEKKSTVDENIITEGTFLKNKEFFYELESKIKTHVFQEAIPIKEIMPAPEPTPLPTYYITPVVEPSDKRHRRILPKRDTHIQNTPIVVVQPFGKGNIPRNDKSRAKTKKQTHVKKAKGTAVNKSTVRTKVKEVLNMPSIKTPAHDKEARADDVTVSENKTEEVVDEKVNEKIIEEKENMKSNEKKTETPVIVVKKASKRLSLSTPRRRSHIRALEFETPPKSANEKKSKTSPKVKVDEVKVKNKNVRNTLFKSPDPDTIFKTPTCLQSDKKTSPNTGNSTDTDVRDNVSISQTSSTATENPKTKPGEAWENVTEVGCVVAQPAKTTLPKKSWDADLRDFISAANEMNNSNVEANEKKRTKKSKRSQRDDKKSTKKQQSPKKSKVPHTMQSPSKISLTAKRNTYSISGNEECSPVRSLLEELDLVTPFKDPEPVRSVEETPLTKLFRENVNALDIDLNMMNTPIFPPTPSIITTPDVDDSLSMAGTYYYTPLKDSGKERITKTETFRSELMKMDELIPSTEPPENARKKGAKEIHEKEIGELVSKAKEIVGLRTSENEEHLIKKPPSGKVLSMVKIQMITQCDKKLYENIPINEETVHDVTTEQESTLIENISDDGAKFDLKCELEEKRQRALKKIKSMTENVTSQTKRKKLKRSPVKRKRSGEIGKAGKKIKKDSRSDTSPSNGKLNESNESIVNEVEVYHSTPYSDRRSQSAGDSSRERVDRSMLDEIREEFPLFDDSGEFPELPVKTRKKLHYIKHFLKSDEIVKFFENSNENKSARLKLKRSHKKFFLVFYKWLKHPHAREVNTSERTKNLFKEYRSLFERIKSAVSFKISDDDSEGDKRDGYQVSSDAPDRLSDDNSEIKKRKGTRKKEDDADDGPVSILPLKKRKATVQPLELTGGEADTPSNVKAKSSENPTRTQTFLQDIDVDRFLSQIHGQENGSETKDIENNNQCNSKAVDVNVKEETNLMEYCNNYVDGSFEVLQPNTTCKISQAPSGPSGKLVINVVAEDKIFCDSKKKPKIWKCVYDCGKIFTQEKYMRNHILIMHENSNSVQCEICFKYLSTKGRLKSHMLRHSGVDRLVCLICIRTSANDLSCMRNHLLEKHGIGGKHSFFHELYYEMSLKEMALMKNYKLADFIVEEHKKYQDFYDPLSKSANNVEELKWKLMEKSKKAKSLVDLMRKTGVKDGGEKIKHDMKSNSLVINNNKLQFCEIKLKKIVTAENGMMLMKLPNGEFKKIKEG